VTGKPRYGPGWFRIRFGRLQLKAYTKGEHVLRFEATVHNAKELRCRRSLDNFSQIIDRLAGMPDRFAAALDCAGIGFMPEGCWVSCRCPPRPASRIAGINLNKPRIRAALAAALALAAAPGGLTVAEHAARVRQITGHDGYTIRQAAYDLRKLRGKQLVDKPAGPPATTSATRRPHHQRLAHPPRPCHRPDPGRSPQPPHGPQAQDLDRRRPRPRDPAHRHANPVPARRHRDAASSCIDNICRSEDASS
jgi:hypothetical protein